MKTFQEYLDDVNQANQRLDNIRNQSKEYVDEAGRVRIERDAAQKEASSYQPSWFGLYKKV